MAINVAALNITLDGTGTEIPTLNVTDPYEKYYILGNSIIATGNYAIVPTGTPQNGTTFIFKYRATLDITSNSKTFSIFGQSFTQNQLNSDLDIECYYSNSAWLVEIKPSFTSQIVETINIVAAAVGTNELANGSVTTPKLATNAVTTIKVTDLNITTQKLANLSVIDAKINDVNGSKIVDNSVSNQKLAQMANLTIKGNISGSTANVSDIPVSSLFNNYGWSLTGNSGTTAGTNFIGTTDAQDIVFKVSSLESGRISVSASNTTALGVGALALNSSGTNNSAFGAGALNYLTSGDSNTAVGVNALGNITGGNNNIGIGEAALQTATTGTRNIAIGVGADVDNNAASNRVAIGYQAVADADNQFALADTLVKVKFRGVTYTLPSSLPAGDAVLHCSSTGVLTWV